MQTAAGRPIPLLPQPSQPGSVIQAGAALTGLTGPVELDPELERMSIAYLNLAARDALPVVQSADSAVRLGFRV